MHIKQHIPNFLTLTNAFFGGMAVVSIINQQIETACLFVLLGAFVDFFDGFVARALKVSSEIGKQLDSLSDVITFGVVPALLAGYLYHQGLAAHPNPETGFFYCFSPRPTYNIHPLILIIIPFSAYRLAKFNLDTRQSMGFLGLPTPANAVFWVGLAFCEKEMSSNPKWHDSSIIHLLHQPYLILALSIIFSILLVTEIPLFAMKFKSYGWKGNEIKFIFLGVSLLLLILMPFVALPIIIILYLLLSIINNFITRNHELRS